MLAGSQHREIGTAISTDNASWRGPNTENFEKKFYRQCKLGRDRNKFFENIIFVLLPLSFLS
ncbi:nitrogen fixation protein NifR [Staphylococcus aureus]|nr:nitrogen fixation protein NifR [Staphylococcus aureus]HAR7127376.1 nitrogen fixation protein NifR [Staphylococcus aureus]